MSSVVAPQRSRPGGGGSNPLQRHEAALAEMIGVRYALCFGYGRHALMALLHAQVGDAGGDVVLSALTCKVVPLAILALGMVPIYADIDPQTLNLDANRLASTLTPRTRAILFQHTYGSAGGRDAVARVAAAAGVPLLEDCAQRLPCRLQPSRPVPVGAGGLFSNNLRKPLPAGSGGVAATDDPAIAERVSEFRGRLSRRGVVSAAALRIEMWMHRAILRPRWYWPLFNLSRRLRSTYQTPGVAREIAAEITATSFALTPHQVETGTRWLSMVDQLVEQRSAAARYYAERLPRVPGIALSGVDVSEPLYYFPVSIPNKERLLDLASRRRVEVMAWPGRTLIYPVEDPATLHQYGYQPGSCPEAERVAERLVGLPTDLMTGQRERDAVIALIGDHLGAS